MWNGVCMVETKAPVAVVCDAGPIIHLGELNCLDLLCDFQEILVSNTVWDEVNRHRPSALEQGEKNFSRISSSFPTDENLLTMCRVFSLDAGETEALGLMEQNPNHIFLTDDAGARLVAEQMAYKIHGTIGILVRAIRRGQKKPKDILRIIGEIPGRSTLHIKSSLIDDIKATIKREFNL